MINLFKKFKVIKSTTVVYDTYQEGSYMRNKTVTIPENAIIVGDKITKGSAEYISFNAKAYGVDELVQIPRANTKYLFPWIPVIIAVTIFGIIIYWGFKQK